MIKKIFSQLNWKDQQLPREFRMQAKPRRFIPLNNPDIMVQNNPRIKAAFADGKIQPAQIKATLMDRLRQPIETIQRYMNKNNVRKSVSFTMHEESGRPVATLVNTRTGEVIKRYPADEILNLSARLKRAGAIHNSKA